MNSFLYAISMIRETYYSKYTDKGEECKQFYQDVISVLHGAYLCEHIQCENQKYRDFQQKHEQIDNESILDTLRCRYAKLIKESEDEADESICTEANVQSRGDTDDQSRNE